MRLGSLIVGTLLIGVSMVNICEAGPRSDAGGGDSWEHQRRMRLNDHSVSSILARAKSLGLSIQPRVDSLSVSAETEGERTRGLIYLLSFMSSAIDVYAVISNPTGKCRFPADVVDGFKRAIEDFSLISKYPLLNPNGARVLTLTDSNNKIIMVDGQEIEQQRTSKEQIEALVLHTYLVAPVPSEGDYTYAKKYLDCSDPKK